METEDVFTTEIIAQEGGKIKARAVPDSGHPVYAAHFPGRPVTPGAVILHTLQRIVSRVLGKQYKVCSISSMRFFAPVEPGKVESVIFDIDLVENGQAPGNRAVRVKCTVADGETRYSRIDASLTPYI